MGETNGQNNSAVPMTAANAKEILDKVVAQVFGYQNPLTLEQAREKFAFDLRLPKQVTDSTTGQTTWASSVNPTKFITVENMFKREDWLIPPRALNGIEDIIAAWAETNFTATERFIDSVNIGESDNIYNSENVFRSLDIHDSKNAVFCEGVKSSEFCVASSRCTTSSFVIRCEDSQLTTNSFNVIWSAKVSNSYFIQDCYDVMDCMFCSHIAGKRFCIANMQFDEAEYNRLKPMVIKWILTS
jgi:hypothetical protein